MAVTIIGEDPQTGNYPRRNVYVIGPDGKAIR